MNFALIWPHPLRIGDYAASASDRLQALLRQFTYTNCRSLAEMNSFALDSRSLRGKDEGPSRILHERDVPLRI